MSNQMHERIRNILDGGHEVFSCALGRIGHVLDVYDDLDVVKVKHPSREGGVTTFERGDKVDLRWNEDKNRYEVHNV